MGETDKGGDDPCPLCIEETGQTDHHLRPRHCDHQILTRNLSTPPPREPADASGSTLNGSKNALEQVGDGWETTSEGGDEGKGYETDPTPHEKFEDALTEEVQVQILTRNLSTAPPREPADASGSTLNGSKNALEQVGDGWETTSEGGDEGKGYETNPSPHEKFEDALTEEEQVQILTRNLSTPPPREPADASGSTLNGSKNALEQVGDGWETTSEGGDEGKGYETDPTPHEKFEDALTEEEQVQNALSQGNAAKLEGNQLYVAGKFDEALSLYSTALELAPDHDDAKEMCAICHANRAMCYLQLGHNEEAVTESTKALDLNPTYVKALIRRAQGQEKLDHLEEALGDMKKVLELDPTNKEATKTVRRIEPLVTERREKLKEEMLGKLKDLGNSVLGRFGMSVDNFKAVKDPGTGSYSISFQK